MNRFRVAVTGLGVVCAAGLDVQMFAEALREGKSGLARVRGEGFNEDVFGGQIDDAGLAAEISRRGLSMSADLSRPSRLAILAASEALSSSGLVGRVEPTRFGVAMGKCQGQAMLPNGTRERIEEPLHAVGRWFGLSGPRIMISTACAASTNAIGVARDKLWSGEADAMLAGGAEELSVVTLRGFQSMQAVSGGRCAPYSRSDGLNLGEGAAFLILEPLESALDRGARIFGELLGYGLSADAYHPTAPDPVGRGAASAMRRALKQASVNLADISYINGHGTGTPANDKMERTVMRSLFGDRVGDVPVSSTKSFVGHALGAAGAVEAVACILAIDQGFLPPTVGFTEPDPEFDFVPNEARDALVSIVVSNNYAFGGNNASIVFAQPRGSQEAAEAVPEREVAITGIGLVGPLGVGVEDWHVALAEGRSGLVTLEAATDERDAVLVGLLPQIDGRGYAPPNDWRHMDAITQQGLACTRLALADAQLALSKADRDDAAFMFGTAHGPTGVGRRIGRDDGRDVTPRSFAQVTVNAAAGRICQVLGLRGPTSTIATGTVSGTSAFAAAYDLVASGEAPFAIVVATDELLDVAALTDSVSVSRTQEQRPSSRIRHPGAAAVALVLEPMNRAVGRGVVPYCGVKSVWQGSGSVDATLRAAISKADVDASAVDYAVGTAGEAESVAIASVLRESAMVSTPEVLTGHCAAASGAVGIAVAALALRQGSVVMPAAPVGAGRCPPPTEDYVHRRDSEGSGASVMVEIGAVLDADPNGATCAIVLGRVA